MDIQFIQIATLAEAKEWLDQINGTPAHFMVCRDDPFKVQGRVQGARALAADFCHTLTGKGQWDAMREQLLTPEQAAENQKMFDDYLEAHRGREATREEQARFEHQLVYFPIQCMRDHRVTRSDLEMLATSLPSRPGVKELFEAFHIGRSVVISFGIAEIVEAHLKRLGIRTDVLAARLKFDAEGRIQMVLPETIVVGSEKDRVLKAWLLKERPLRPDSLMVVGDDPTVDGRMFGTRSANFLVRRGDGKMRHGHLAPEHWDRLTGIASDLEVLAHLRNA